MRKVVYGLNVSLDGYYTDVDGKIDFTVPTDELMRHFAAFERDIAVHLYGRKLYETMSYWKTAAEGLDAAELEYAKAWKNKPNIVFSRTLERVDEGDRLVRDHIAEVVHELKNGPGKYMVVGGGEIASTFIQLGLVDEYRFYLVPVVLGSGKPLFRSLTNRLPLKFIDSQVFESGVVLLRYQNAG